MTAFVQGLSRHQHLLLPDSVEDYVREENSVRFIDSFVDGLDMGRLGFLRAEPSERGRPAYDPRDLLKLYLYGYLHGVRSSRRLEQECHRNLELIWLLKKLAPDFKTIADFRRDNVDRVPAVFQELNRLCAEVGLLDGELVGIDGTKLKAVNASSRSYNKRNVEDRLKALDKKVLRYLKEMDENDAKEEAEVRLPQHVKDLPKKIEELKKRRAQLEGIQARMEATGEREICLTDPESRTMPNNGRMEVCYNARIAVDSKARLVVAYDVDNNATDRQALADLSLQAKEALGVSHLEVVADKGFHSAVELERCLDHGILPFVPKPDHDAGGAKIHGAAPEFAKDRFIYDPLTDSYRCPAGQRLSFWRETPHYSRSNPEGWNLRIYATKACQGCPHHLKGCTTNPEGRNITRGEHAEAVERTDALRATPQGRARVELRKTLVEHPFGTIKRAFGQGYLLLKGRRKVRGEVGLTWIAYNLRRMINLVGTLELSRRLRSPA